MKTQKQRAILLMICAVTLYTVMYMFAKKVTDLSGAMIVCVRYAVTIFLIILTAPILRPLIKSSVPFSWQLKEPFIMAMWGLISAAGTVFCYESLKRIGLAESRTILLLEPIILYFPSILIHKERLHWPQFLTVVLGFIGVLLIFRPETESLWNLGCFMALACAFFCAAGSLVLGKISKIYHPITSLFYLSIFIVLFSSLYTYQEFSSLLVSQHLFDLGMVTVIGYIAFLLLVMAFQYSTPNTVVPFHYLSLPLSILLGYMVFGDIPTPHALVGMGVIILSSLTLFKIYKKH